MAILSSSEMNNKDNLPAQLSLREGELAIAPFAKLSEDLEYLLALVTKKNLHREVGTGPVLGDEAW